MFCRDLDATTPPLNERDGTFLGVTDSKNVLTNFYSQIFTKYALMLIRFQIQLQRLGFDTQAVRIKLYQGFVKVRLSGDWADRQQLVTVILNVLAGRLNPV